MKRKRGALLIRSHILHISHLSLSPFFSFLSFAPPLAEAGAGQGRVQVLKLSLCVLLPIPFFYAFLFSFYFRFILCSRRSLDRFVYSLDLSLFLSGFFSPLIICFFFFTKITEQHQHLFLLKPTLSSAGRPTKTEADHFLFLSFTRMHASNTCTQHTQTHTHTRIKYTYTLSLL